MNFSSDLQTSSVPVRIVEAVNTDPIDASDAFVLDCIDGISTIEELSMFVAMSEEELLNTLLRLSEQGLVRIESMPDDVYDADDVTELPKESSALRRPSTDSQITNPLDTRGYWGGDEEQEQEHTFKMGIPAVASDDDTAHERSLPPLPPSRGPKSSHGTTHAAGNDSGGTLIHERDDHGSRAAANRATPRRGLDTSWWRTKEHEAAVSSTHVTAHSNSGLRFPYGTTPPPAPLKKSAYEDKTGPVAIDQRLVKQHEITGSRDIVSPEPSISEIWGNEPISDSLKDELDAWTDDELRRVSYYIKTVETQNYYQVFDVAQDATTDEIMEAARTLQKTLGLDLIREHSGEAGRMELSNLEISLDRALEVLWEPKARARYDAALRALALLQKE